MNKPIRRLAGIVLMMFGALLVSTTAIQFVQAAELRDKPGNRRTLLDNYSRQRGPIVVGNKPIAESVPTDDSLKYRRKYIDPELYSHLTGYYSFLYGAGPGIERSEDAALSGSSDALFYRRLVDLLSSREPKGASTELTINPEAQQVAHEALGNQRGAVVALDPRTGAILAMVSHPTYDPNQISSHDLDAVTRSYQQLSNDKKDPLTNRAIGGDLYPPGSTFKVITAAAALESGKYTEKSSVYGGASLDLPLTTVDLPNQSGAACGAKNRVDLTRAMAISCNTAFGFLGLDLGADALRSQAQKFGFGDRMNIPMPVTPSSVPDGMNAPQTAQAAIGQFDVRVTPLQVAMMSAGIANDGLVMEPYLVKAVRSPDLDVISETEPQELSRAVSVETAEQITRMMQSVVEDGTGSRAQISGVSVAGKTGTAQQGNGQPPHAWFTSFAPADNPRVAVAVVVEDGGNAGNEAAGGRVSAPIAQNVMEAVLR
ncbi:MAG: peptidoglycan D,D-transpeptidase FtsI family protein [Actinomycetota bacterium]